jgi:short-subunit dehydrogenase
MSAHRYNVVLTGASGGLGQAFAMALAVHSGAMVLAGRDALKLNALRRRIEAAAPRVALRVVAGDLTEAAAQQAVLREAQSLREPVDLLINAAGVNEFHPFDSQPRANVERIIAVDLLAPMQLTQCMLPLLLRAPRAQVINVGSVFGYLGYPGFAAYCAAKFGLRGFSQALRRELSDTNVTVRYFAPRATRTPLTTPAISAMNRELKTREDAPEAVASLLVRFIGGRDWDRKLGFPERLYVLLNDLVPRLNDSAIRRQLRVIRRHFGSQRQGVDI